MNSDDDMHIIDEDGKILFATERDLLDFVLKECGDMIYAYGQLNKGNRSLTIKSEFDMERIYYAYILLKEQFEVNIKQLDISDLDITSIPKGFLDKMELNSLYIYGDDLNVLPRINDSVTKIIFDFPCDIYLDIEENENVAFGEPVKMTVSGFHTGNFALNEFGIQLDWDGVHDDWYIIDGKLKGDDCVIKFADEEDIDKIEELLRMLYSPKKVRWAINEFRKHLL